jgi:hypothetical protein
VRWKRRGQNTESKGGWTSRGKFREASGKFAGIDDPQPTGLPRICGRPPRVPTSHWPTYEDISAPPDRESSTHAVDGFANQAAVFSL